MAILLGSNLWRSRVILKRAQWRKAHQPRSRLVSTLPRLSIIEALVRHEPRTIAVKHSISQDQFEYGRLLHDVTKGIDYLSGAVGSESIQGARIGLLVENGYNFVVALLSILGAQAIALPLSSNFPVEELRYILNDSEAQALLASHSLQTKAHKVLQEGVDKQLHVIPFDHAGDNPTTHLEPKYAETKPSEVGGILLYTSGTTSKPKGVLLPHSVLSAQCQSLAEAWKYSSSDRILHCLPLHHIHGIINALLTPLYAGSSVEFLFPFDPGAVWERFGAPFLNENEPSSKASEPITFFTAVPTIYNRLLSHHQDLPRDLREASKIAISPQNLRLNISGSAALPTPIKSAWTDLSNGNILLERYGMTEVGMALSCGLDYKDRIDGSVGWPLPRVEARLVSIDKGTVIEPGDEVDLEGKEREGEIQLRGPTVFKGYWRNPKATSQEFVDDQDSGARWFKTGDIATRRRIPHTGENEHGWAKGPMYFIKGRKSVDIIKTGGEKVSALEVERELLLLPQITEAAVVGLPSERWGQKVAAIVVLNPQQGHTGSGGKPWGAMDMRRALKDKLASYKIPQELKIMADGLPRNAMGKVNKKKLAEDIFGSKG